MSVKTFSLNNKNIYYQGNIELLDYDTIGIVGTRKPSKETVDFIQKFVNKIAKEKVIISGLALGTDKIAHEACLDNDGLTIAILPSGLSQIYPLKHKPLVKRILDNDGLIISEYEPNKKANRRRFIERDNLIATLSDDLMVPECKIKSGTMHTVRSAIKQNKKILVRDKKYEGNQYILKSYENSISI